MSHGKDSLWRIEEKQMSISTTEPLCLRRLLEKGAEWDWAKGCLSVFDALKYHLTSAPILAYPDFYRLFTVDVDDGGDGLGAVLWQREWKELWRT
ncbi:hypothetical protein T12_10686 [Trichinella patagoniensis]|uniref:Reverse transcriptase/retrotransposon-derived protein RNase H-like domain-containing protein n=1 Tax=Trichinella patagoniensis TaxID=990121 RepID=A0A0V0Z4J8_9BILA|nr:hypothetical protein T12_10686 [Trichinella patagoniensis]